MPASASPAQDRAPTSLDETIARLRQRAQLEPGHPHASSPAQLLEEALRLLEFQRDIGSALEQELLALRAAQHQTASSLDKYRLLFEHLPMEALLVDPQGFITEANAVARRRFGLHRDAAQQGRSVYELFAPASRSVLHGALNSHEAVTTATPCQLADDGLHAGAPPEVDGHVLTLEGGEQAQRLLVLVDRTFEHQLAVRHAQLTQSEERYRSLFDHSKVPMLLVDPSNGRIVRGNAAAVHFYGHDEAGLQRLTIDDINCMDDAARHRAMQDAQREARNHFLFEHRLADGRVVPVEVHSGPIELDGRTLLYSIIHDISDRVEAQRKAEQAHALLENLAAHVPGALYQFQRFPDGRNCFPYASHGGESLFGVHAADAARDGSVVFSRLHPQDLPRVVQEIERSAALLTPWSSEFRLLRPSGEEQWVSGVASPQPMPDGSILWHGFSSDISAHKRSERAQLEFTRDFGSFLDRTSDYVYFKNRDGRFRFCSQSLADVFGYRNWRDLTGRLDRELFPEEAMASFRDDEARVINQGRPLLDQVNAYTDAAGQPGFVQTSRWPLFDAEGEVEGIFGIAHDVTAKREAEAHIQLAASVFTHAREGIMITDPQGRIIDVNEAFCRITGFSRDEVLGANPRMLNSGRQDADFYAGMWDAINASGHWSGEIWNRRKSGEVYAEILTISAVRDATQQVKNYVAIFTDITLMKEHQSQLERIAHYDMLTGLPNRLLFADRLGQAMRQSERRNRSLAVIYLDLDGFKAVNDQYGHETGDALLVHLAHRMKLALREGDSLARFGGDEFVAVLVDLEQPQDCVPVLDRLLAAAAETVLLPVRASSVALRVSASIGATIYPKDGADADLLMRHADQAMYLAKQAGKNRYHLFDVAHDTAVKSRRDWLEQLRLALERDEFVLHYQPKVDMHSGQVVSAEALIRWQHPQRGLLLPGAFLGSLENHELGQQIGEWVIDQALAQMAEWQAMGTPLRVSVNVGAQQLQQPDFVQRLGSILERHPGLARGSLELEILESSALGDIPLVAQVLHDCQALQVGVALDDFGTGYSSLTYLKHLPARTLKIDQSFVRDMVSDPEDLAIVNGVIGLARAFGRQVIAEGVETAEQGALLLSLGCAQMQGFGIARPMPAAQLPDWVRRWQASPRVSGT